MIGEYWGDTGNHFTGTRSHSPNLGYKPKTPNPEPNLDPHLYRTRINANTTYIDLVQGFQGLRPGAGNAGSMKRDSTYCFGFPPKTPKMTTSGPNPGSGAQNLGLGQMRSFLVVWGEPSVWGRCGHFWFDPSWCQPKAITKHTKNKMAAA